MRAFGPVPSRRLGRSLGVNNIPPKVCTYSCVYCQVGRTTDMEIERRTFYDPEKIVQDVRDKVEKAKEAGEPIDYLTFVPDGEPTLDVNLGREIELLRPLGIKTAVITNASLLWRKDVRADLMQADWVSLKVDSTREDIWRRVNRPHRALQLASIMDGMLEFARAFRGELVTETMLVEGVNEGKEQVEEVAGFVARLKPSGAYLSVPIRPPAETWVQAPAEEAINRAYYVLSGEVGQVEYLVGYEGNAFAFTGNVEEDLLSISAVHPMREDAVDAFLARAGSGWPTVHELLARRELVETEYRGRRFYVRKLHRRHR
ncbi:MAG: radical SAM protein [Anaerolineae bacterium]|nr:radical SAM protein [Anaerolineae bacterium]